MASKTKRINIPRLRPDPPKSRDVDAETGTADDRIPADQVAAMRKLLKKPRFTETPEEQILRLVREKRKLIDLCFEIGLTALSPRATGLRHQTMDKKAAWIVEQLDGCGFPTTPCGGSWGTPDNPD